MRVDGDVWKLKVTDEENHNFEWNKREVNGETKFGTINQYTNKCILIDYGQLGHHLDEENGPIMPINSHYL